MEVALFIEWIQQSVIDGLGGIIRRHVIGGDIDHEILFQQFRKLLGPGKGFFIFTISLSCNAAAKAFKSAAVPKFEFNE